MDVTLEDVSKVYGEGVHVTRDCECGVAGRSPPEPLESVSDARAQSREERA